MKWFNGQRGFGFIQLDDGSKDVFVHISAVESAGMHGLNEGHRQFYSTLLQIEDRQVGRTKPALCLRQREAVRP